MSVLIVPNELSDAINKKLDEAIGALPMPADDRDHLYRQVLAYFDEYGAIPEFTIGRVPADTHGR